MAARRAGRPQIHTSWDEIGWTTAASGALSSRIAMQPDDDSPLIVMAKFPPAARVEAHTHDVDYLEVFLEGEQRVGGRLHKAGDVRSVQAGTGYGPIVTGPEGATVLLVFRDASKFNMVFLPRSEVSSQLNSVVASVDLSNSDGLARHTACLNPEFEFGALD